MTRQQRSKKVWRKWRKVVSEQARSGQSVAVFCRERGVCAPQFFAWKKRLRQAEAAKFVELKLAAAVPEMRCGFDRLAERVKMVIGEDPLSGHWFVFRSRRGDRLKILVWERDGFLLWYKRLEVGVFKIPRVEQGARSVELRASELAMILDGIDVSKLKRTPRYERAARSSEETISKGKNSAEK